MVNSITSSERLKAPISALRCKTVAASDIERITATLRHVRGAHNFDHFTIFGPNTASSDIAYKAWFLLAYKVDNHLDNNDGIGSGKLVGVLKISERFREPGIYSLSYLDVHDQYRNTGVAKGLCEYADTALGPLINNRPLISTGEDGLGRELNISQRLRRYFKRVNYYSSADAYYQSQKTVGNDI